MKVKKEFLKYIKLFLVIIFAIVVAGILWNGVCSTKEKKELKDAYGQSVEIEGKQMTVDIKNSDAGGPPIILLPGWGCASPVLEFKPLAEQLSKEYTVITIEPFGYGLSDETGRERSVENIVEELRECVLKLGYENYYLMGHSISGIYSLYWANTYPEEVKGFIGIDSSVPHMTDQENEPFLISTITLNKLSACAGKIMNITGVTRVLSIGNSEKAVYADFSYPYTEKELDIFRKLSIDKSYNRTVMREMDSMEKNLDTVADYKFPDEVPVLEFVSKQNCEMMPMWETLHKNTLNDNSKLELLEGSHYLHFEKLGKIVSETLVWVENEIKE